MRRISASGYGTGMKSWFAIAAALVLFGCEGGKQCSPDTCGGCCDDQDRCQSVSSALSCGVNGSTCAVCALSQECRGGLCLLVVGSGGGGAGGGGGSIGGGGGPTGGGGGTTNGGGGGTTSGGGGGTTSGGGGGTMGGGGGGVTGGGGGGGAGLDGGLLVTVGCWNLEWFGDVMEADGGYLGPRDNALQATNVTTVLRNRPDVDIWGIEEIVGTTDFAGVVAGLPGYAAVVVTDVPSGTFYYSSIEQKLAVLYRTSKVTVLSAGMILTSSSYNFGGRPPLEVRLRVTGNGLTRDLSVIVLHMKAYADVDSYNRRVAASGALKAYLDGRAADNVMVVGDWNDDVDVSIASPSPSPYANFVADSVRYRFGTKELSDANRRTSASGSQPIDHQLFNAPLFTSYVTGSASATIPSIPSYVSTTSDHYPVTTRFVFR